MRSGPRTRSKIASAQLTGARRLTLAKPELHDGGFESVIRDFGMRSAASAAEFVELLPS
jgi:hypothetical protein